MQKSKKYFLSTKKSYVLSGSLKRDGLPEFNEDTSSSTTNHQPSNDTIRKRHKNFLEEGSICDKKRSAWFKTDDAMS